MALQIVVLVFGPHFLEALRVGCADEVRLHVVNAPLGVHQILVVLTLDLDHSHHHSVDHINRLSFLILSVNTFLIILDTFTVLHVVVHVVCAAVVFVIVDTVLDRGAPLIVNALIKVLVVRILGARLEVHVIKRVVLTASVAVHGIHYAALIVAAILVDVTVQIGVLGLLTQRARRLAATLAREDRVRDRTLPLAL